MANTARGARLTDDHRVAQAKISAQTVARLLQVWPLLDLNDLDGTTRRWLTAAVPIIQNARGASARLAREYLRLFIAAETGQPVAPPDDTPPPEIPASKIETSLIVTGPIAIKVAMTAGQPVDRAAESASTRSAAAGTRHALNGGREVITTEAAANPAISGTVRVVSMNACRYCVSKAADRGGHLDFQAHDNCHCQPEPTF